MTKGGSFRSTPRVGTNLTWPSSDRGAAALNLRDYKLACEVEGTDKGELDDPRQLAFDKLVGAACLLKDQIYRREHMCTEAEMAYALWWDHYECDRQRLDDDLECGVGLAVVIARSLVKRL